MRLVRAADGPVLGPHLVGERVGELVGEAQLIYNSCTLAPTQTEALGEAHLALANRCTRTADQPVDHLRTCGRFLTSRRARLEQL